MCKFIGKSNERILCKLSKRENVRFILPWKLRERQILPVKQNLLSVYFSLAKFQLLSCNLFLAMTWQMTYTRKLPKLCSAILSIKLRLIVMSTNLEYRERQRQGKEKIGDRPAKLKRVTRKFSDVSRCSRAKQRQRNVQ